MRKDIAKDNIKKIIVCNNQRDHDFEKRRWRDSGYHISSRKSTTSGGKDVHLVIVREKVKR